RAVDPRAGLRATGRVRRARRRHVRHLLGHHHARACRGCRHEEDGRHLWRRLPVHGAAHDLCRGRCH
ncbi:hypothetical protein BN1723_019836, partial [Verticillium longisporum]